MREFFKPWRRKIGIVTLGMALCYTGVWIRSQSTKYILEFGPVREIEIGGVKGRKFWAGDRTTWTVYRDGLAWSRGRNSGVQSRPNFRNFAFRSYKNTTMTLPDPTGPYCQAHWHWQWCDFQFGKYDLGRHNRFGDLDLFAGDGHQALWKLPHWSLALPLTLLSAYLLLSKPRQTAPKQGIEPAPTDGT